MAHYVFPDYMPMWIVFIQSPDTKRKKRIIGKISMFRFVASGKAFEVYLIQDHKTGVVYNLTDDEHDKAKKYPIGSTPQPGAPA